MHFTKPEVPITYSICK